GIRDFHVTGVQTCALPILAVGACGLMNAVGNLLPDQLAAMCEAMWEGNLAEGLRLHRKLREINKAVFFDTNPIPIKYMAKRMGRSEERRVGRECGARRAAG